MTTVRHLEDRDRERVAHMQRQAFLLPPERVAIAGRYPAEQGWVVEDGGVVHGALRVQKLGQFFGGRAVPCAAVSSVKVAAESRGSGYGGILLREVLSALRHDGVAVSTLFPVHLGVYRRYGWETAFACQRRRLPLGEAMLGPLAGAAHDGRAFRVEPWDVDGLDEIAAFYTGVAARHNGPFDRSAEWWHERVLATSHGREVYRYLARSANGIGAYMVYSHAPAGANLPYGFELDCRDLLWSDPAAAAAILVFVRGHAGMGHGFQWIGPAADPLEHGLRGLGPSTEKRLVAMCRIVDIPRALAARGYPTTLDARLGLRVTDDILPANAGTYEISWSRGSATVERVDEAAGGEAAGGDAAKGSAHGGAAAGAPTLDVRTLAALFTGWLDAGAAVGLGLLAGADDEAVATLRAAFAGPAPWMAEFF